MTTIFRPQNEEEKKDFKDIGPYRQKDPKTIFLTELANKRSEKTKVKIPFFKKAAMDDFDDYYKEEVKKSVRKNGFAKLDEIKPIKMNWSKYSSTDSIKLVEVTEQRDANISKKFPFDVFVKVFRYKYKGYGNEGDYNISIMEDETEAVKRCKAVYDNKEFKEKSVSEKVSEQYK